MAAPNVYSLIFSPKSFDWENSPCSLKMLARVEEAFASCDGCEGRPDAVDVIDFLYGACEASANAGRYFAKLLAGERAQVLLDIQPGDVPETEYLLWIKDLILFYNEKGAFD